MRIRVTILDLDQLRETPIINQEEIDRLTAEGITRDDFDEEFLNFVAQYDALNVEANADGTYDVYNDPLEPQFASEVADLTTALITDFYAYVVNTVD